MRLPLRLARLSAGTPMMLTPGAALATARADAPEGTQMTKAGAIAAMRAALRRTLRQPREQLWLLLHAPSLLDGPASAANAIALAEDDYRRLAVRRRETRATRLRHRSAPAP
jgi:hypothetical protein